MWVTVFSRLKKQNYPEILKTCYYINVEKNRVSRKTRLNFEKQEFKDYNFLFIRSEINKICLMYIFFSPF